MRPLALPPVGQLCYTERELIDSPSLRLLKAAAMDPLRLCLALGPVAVYMLVLGALNLSRRPLVVSGMRDTSALGLAVFGLILVGPLELFVPYAAVAHYGWYVWPLLLGFYAMCLVLTLLVMRPRLIVYNVSAEGVHLHFEPSVWMRNVSLVSSGGRQDHLGWRRLDQELSAALAPIELTRNPRGFSLLSAGTLILAWLVINIARDPQAVGQALIDLLRL